MGRKFVIKIFALKNFKINIHQNVSRAFNIFHYKCKDVLELKKFQSVNKAINEIYLSV